MITTVQIHIDLAKLPHHEVSAGGRLHAEKGTPRPKRLVIEQIGPQVQGLVSWRPNVSDLFVSRWRLINLRLH